MVALATVVGRAAFTHQVYHCYDHNRFEYGFGLSPP